MFAGRRDASKVSFHAALAMAKEVVVLPSGSALGFGVGPLLLAAPGREHPARHAGDAPPRVLCPGEWTTATLLWKLFHPEEVSLEQCVFSDIMPALRASAADFGVCIHEGRFTWRDEGLAFVEDLGETWERATESALPLGGIVARRSLGHDVLARLQEVVRDSLEWGLAHRAACLDTMRTHAQEQSDDVLWAHVDLYVNEWTLELGQAGRDALDALSTLARERDALRADVPALDIL